VRGVERERGDRDEKRKDEPTRVKTTGNYTKKVEREG
jgi:hypothetical protein